MHRLEPDQVIREQKALPQLAVNLCALNGRLASRDLSVELRDWQPGDPENYRLIEFVGDLAGNADLLRQSGAAHIIDRRPNVRARDRQPDRYTYEHLPTEISRFALNLLALLG